MTNPGEGGGRALRERAGGGAWTRRDTLVLLGLLAVQAILVALAFTPTPHTGGDNAGYLGLAHSLAERGAYLDLYLPGEPAHTKYPPLFPGLLALLSLLGVKSWFGFKALAGVSTVAAVALVFLWARARRGPLFALGVAGLTGISSAVIYYSHWVLSDPPFLAFTLVSLWALERSDDADGPGAGWLALGLGGAVLAYFTRTAGLPVVAAVGAWLVLRRRWGGLAGLGAAFGAPALLWWLRNRSVTGEGAYLSEFWLVDPYQPELGRAGVGDLASRVVQNGWGYVSAHVPGGITGLSGPVAAAIGVVLAGLAAWGWWLRVRERVGVAELVLPLYGGLILLWPVVWSGDRFALPLLPLALFYAGVALVDGVGARSRDWGVAAAAVAILAVGGAGLQSWTEAVGSASRCMSRARSDGPWACAGPRMLEFVAAAGWSGANLPASSVVVSRKPRFFYLLSGLRSDMYPLSREPDVVLDAAREMEARYLVFDYLDGLSGYYLVPVLRSRPETFCPLRGFADVGGVGTQLLALLPEGTADAPPPGDGRGIRLPPCPDGAGLTRPDPAPVPDYSSGVVPLLSRAAP